MYLLFSSFVTAFLPRSNCLLISWLQSPSAVFWGTRKEYLHCFHFFPIFLPWSDGTGCHDLGFLNVEFKSAFSLSSFTFIKRLFSSSSLSVIRVVLAVYLRLLIFLQTILIPACDSSSQAFCMLYSACKLNKQDDNIQHKLESRLLGEASITSDMQMTPPLCQKVKKNWRASWWKWKRRVKKLA